MQKFKVAVVGAGYVSSHHLQALKGLDFVDVVGIADLNLARAEAVAARFRIPRAFRSFSEMRATSPDVVHVLTPPDCHSSVSIEALESGCHVLVEKPMASTERDCRMMIEAARDAGRVLSVNHSARMDPVVLRAAELVRSGACGKVTAVDFFRSSDYPPFAGGPNLPPHYQSGAYPFQDLGVHGLTLLETFLGRVKSVDAHFWHAGSDPCLAFDEWRAVLQCEGGVGQMYLTFNSRPIRSELFVHGTRGVLHVDCFLQTCLLTKSLPGPKFLSNVIGAMWGSAQTLVRVPINTARFAIGKLPGAPGIHVSVARFYEALRASTPVPIPAEEGERMVAAMQPVVSRADKLRNAARGSMLAARPAAEVMVTGAAGFLGSRLVHRLLKQGKQVRILVRRSIPEWEGHPLLQVVCGDLGDPDLVDSATREVQTVFHLGATMRGSAADFNRGTVWGTRNIVDSCLRNQVKRLVYVSSLSVLDHAGHDSRVSVGEASPLEPHAEKRGLYTQTKLAAENIVRKAISDHGLAAVILRPGHIIGQGAERTAPPGVMPFGKHWIVVGNGKRALPLVHVEDVVDALLLAADDTQPENALYNVVDSQTICQRAYLRTVRTCLDGIRVHYVPEWILLAAAWGCDLISAATNITLPLSRYRVRSIRPLEPFDITAANEGLRWKPTTGISAALSENQTGAGDLNTAACAQREHGYEASP